MNNFAILRIWQVSTIVLGCAMILIILLINFNPCEVALDEALAKQAELYSKYIHTKLDAEQLVSGTVPVGLTKGLIIKDSTLQLKLNSKKSKDGISDLQP